MPSLLVASNCWISSPAGSKRLGLVLSTLGAPLPSEYQSCEGVRKSVLENSTSSLSSAAAAIPTVAFWGSAATGVVRHLPSE